jgi:hypothetical protein
MLTNKYVQIQPNLLKNNIFIKKNSVSNIIAYYTFQENPDKYIEHTFVFDNEIYMYPKDNYFRWIKAIFFNIGYNIYRFFRYGRITDIETFKEFPSYIYIDGSYSNNLKYDDLINKHYTTKISKDNDIYINTWNNLFNIKVDDINDYCVVNLKDLYNGELSRINVDKKYSINFPWKNIFSEAAKNAENVNLDSN